jgi:hypothetical protein
MPTSWTIHGPWTIPSRLSDDIFAFVQFTRSLPSFPPTLPTLSYIVNNSAPAYPALHGLYLYPPPPLPTNE